MVKPAHSLRLPSPAAAAFVELDSAPGSTPVLPVSLPNAQPAGELDARPADGLTARPASLQAVPPAGTPAGQSADAPAGQPAERSAGRRKTVRRVDGRVLRKQTIYLEAELARRLAVHCAANGQDISEAVAVAVEGMLAAAR